MAIEGGLQATVDWFKKHVPINEAVLSSLQSQNWDEVEPEEWLQGFFK